MEFRDSRPPRPAAKCCMHSQRCDCGQHASTTCPLQTSHALLMTSAPLRQAYEDRNAKKNKSEAAYYSQHKTYMAEG